MSGMDIFITIITPLGILFAIALVFGVILSYAGKKLEVKVDEKEEEVLSLLANANCGACGYPGCSGFAKALCEGKAELNMCSATPGENKKKIAGILGIDAGDTGEKRSSRLRRRSYMQRQIRIHRIRRLRYGFADGRREQGLFKRLYGFRKLRKGLSFSGYRNQRQ